MYGDFQRIAAAAPMNTPRTFHEERQDLRKYSFNLALQNYQYYS